MNNALESAKRKKRGRMSLISLGNADVHQVIAASHHAVADKSLAPLVLAVSELCMKDNLRPEVALIHIMEQGLIIDPVEQGEAHA